ncbi:MAG TPA: hypothetical protein VFA98_13280 [Thermoanaerobaculia bacterium]|jgi:hypothetical protein|nr:hypothetical protein [Thermoanaerobaculia bacterium]
MTESYTESIKKLAQTLRTRLTEEEFLLLLDISGDYALDAILYRELFALKPPVA